MGHFFGSEGVIIKPIRHIIKAVKPLKSSLNPFKKTKVINAPAY